MNVLEYYGNHLKPLNESIKNYNEFWHAQYFNYDPVDFRISSYGGGSYFNAWESGQANDFTDPDASKTKKNSGYIPMLDITTEETHGYTIIELNHDNATRLLKEQPNVYEWLDYILRRESQDNWLGFGWNDDKEYCHGIGSETLTGPYDTDAWGKKREPYRLFLCFGTGGGEAYDSALRQVIRVKDVSDNLDYGHVGDFIADYCSPRLSQY